MNTYFCETCPVVFTLGMSVSRGLDGDVERLVCRSCGTMHRLSFHNASSASDMRTGSSELFALPRPYRSPIQLWGRTRRLIAARRKGETITDWVKVGEFQNRPELETLVCNHCKTQSGLIGSQNLVRNQDGSLYCPGCDGPIKCISSALIN